jgi:putative MFS transporter
LTGVLSMVSGVLALLIVGLLVLKVETNQQSLEDISAPESDVTLSGVRTDPLSQ